ncbi:MAG: hypothetical protein IVW54_13320 [Candidatus Binataceae bacterium]|nr:hypothetical protein [Candidatus Binataceae bacterium]
MIFQLLAGCATPPVAAPTTATSCAFTALGDLGGGAIPVSVSDDNSLLSAAQAIDAAASRINSDAQPFAYQVRFRRPLKINAERGDRAAAFEMTGLFERPCVSTEYLTLGWGYAGRSNDRAYAAIVPVSAGQACTGTMMVLPSSADALTPPVPEPAENRPVIAGWMVDLPQIMRAMRRNKNLFSNGVESLQVTTAKRLRIDDRHPAGCTRMVYNRSSHYRRIKGINDTQPVIELVESGKPVGKSNLAGYCTAGHYLILDAGTATAIEHGRYQRCEAFAA